MTDAGTFTDSGGLTGVRDADGNVEWLPDSSLSVSLLERYSGEFDDMVTERHRKGAEKYGPGKFLHVDTMQEALFELADLANYARYTFIKIRALQDRIAQEGEPAFKKMRD